MDRFELRKQNDAFLLVRIGTRNNRDHRFGHAGIVGKMRNVSGNIEKISRLDDGMVFQTFSVPHVPLTTYGIDRRLVSGVLMRLCASLRRNTKKLHMDRFCADRLRRNADGVFQPLFPGERLTGTP